MNIKRWVPILIGITLIAFGVGAYSLRVNENFNLYNIHKNNNFTVESDDSIVKIGPDGIQVRDGDNHVDISWKGIKVKDGRDDVSIDWEGIKVNNNGIFSIFKEDFFGFRNNSRNMTQFEVNQEEFASLDKIDNIDIKSSFIDVKVIEEDRDDVRIKYYGRMRSNILPELIVKNKSDSLSISLDTKANSYSVSNSNVVLEIYVPTTYDNNYSLVTSSADVDMESIKGRNVDITTSSGDIELNNVTGEKINLTSSSGDIDLEKSIGHVEISTSSGDVDLDVRNNNNEVNIITSSGDVEIEFSSESNYNVIGTTSSGDINKNGILNLVKDDSRNFSLKAGNGENPMNIKTSSGDVLFIKK